MPCFKPCAIERGRRLVGGKWTDSILWNLMYGPARSNDLAQRLAEGAKASPISRTVEQTKPLAVGYAVASFGIRGSA